MSLTDTGDGWIRTGRVRYRSAVADRLTRIDDVEPHPENYNSGDIDLIEASILDHGMIDDLLVQTSTGFILAGNGTWEACKRLGATHVPITLLDCDDAEAKRIIVDMNAVARRARPDEGLLLALVDSIEDAGHDLPVGLSPEEVRSMRAEAVEPLDLENFSATEYAGWPTLSIQMPPEDLAAFYDLTEECETNRDRFALLLKKAGRRE